MILDYAVQNPSLILSFEKAKEINVARVILQSYSLILAHFRGSYHKCIIGADTGTKRAPIQFCENCSAGALAKKGF